MTGLAYCLLIKMKQLDTGNAQTTEAVRRERTDSRLFS